MIVGLPPPFTSARVLPATSPLTFANCFAWSRHTFAGADSKPEGPGVSRSFFKKVRDSEEIISWSGRNVWFVKLVLRGPEYSTRSQAPAPRARERLLQFKCTSLFPVLPNLTSHENKSHSSAARCRNGGGRGCATRGRAEF